MIRFFSQPSAVLSWAIGRVQEPWTTHLLAVRTQLFKMREEQCIQLHDFQNPGLHRLSLDVETVKEVNKIASDPYKFRQSKVKCVYLRDGNREQRSERRSKQAVDLVSPFLPRNVQTTFNIILLKWPHECNQSNNYTWGCSECICREKVFIQKLEAAHLGVDRNQVFLSLMLWVLWNI